jgi:hypothetical protein
MIGVIEFLRKAKAICESRPSDNNKTPCDGCPLHDFCLTDINGLTDEADLVGKVMGYQLQNDDIDYKAEYEEDMKRDFNICDVCEDNQITDCAYLENNDRKSCHKVMDYRTKEESK